MTANAAAARPAAADFGHYPHARHHRHRFGLLVPASNTTMEHDLWTLIVRNRRAGGLAGIGLHTTRIVTPRTSLRTDADRARYGEQILSGLADAAATALAAQPQSLILGMSLEHVVAGLVAVHAPVARLAESTGLRVAAWHDAASEALQRLGARRIGLLTPFDGPGTATAAQMFEELGFDVAARVGLACADARQIAHVPEWAKEGAVFELWDRGAQRLDAIVQCGTNMSVLEVAARLEPVLGIPVLGNNPVTFWYALRSAGVTAPVHHGGRLLREF